MHDSCFLRARLLSPRSSGNLGFLYAYFCSPLLLKKKLADSLIFGFLVEFLVIFTSNILTIDSFGSHISAKLYVFLLV